MRDLSKLAKSLGGRAQKVRKENWGIDLPLRRYLDVYHDHGRWDFFLVKKESQKVIGSATRHSNGELFIGVRHPIINKALDWLNGDS